LNYPIAIEATGYTLEVIKKLEPLWIQELIAAIHSGHVEFIGSGYSQIIAPLVPHNVNKMNLEEGRKVYEKLLGLTPRIWYMNEQAYSAGIVENYLNQNASAIIMEWNNARAAHPSWSEDTRFFPQVAQGVGSSTIPVIWNDSILFQKFQRVAHNDDYKIQEFVDYLKQFKTYEGGSLCLYGSDAEVFNFRPGRYETEAKIEDDEWERVRLLYQELKANGFNLIFPSEALEHKMDDPIRLGSAEHPIVVKKQPKYNATRWAVTGRDNVKINTICHRLEGKVSNKELCYLWSSDFRSHITEKRWNEYLDKLSALIQKEAYVLNTENELWVKTNNIILILNKNKGLAIKHLSFDSEAMVGTIKHGHYKNMALSPDWYSGNMTLQSFGVPQVTDLARVTPQVLCDNEDAVIVMGIVKTLYGDVTKIYTVKKKVAQIELTYNLQWRYIPKGSLHLGNITFLPEAFKKDTLFYSTHNGGKDMERYDLKESFDHTKPATSVVSASNGLGATEGTIFFGDEDKGLWIMFDKKVCAAMPMLTYIDTGDSFFARLTFSCGEMDESRPDYVAGPLHFTMRLME
jgi:hypothetical protein